MNMKYLFITISSLTVTVAAAAPLRVELNGDNGRRDVLTRGWTDWRVPDGVAATTTIGDLTFRLRAVGDGSKLTAGWWTRGFDFGATLASDGIQVAGPGAAIELVIEGLPPGPHSLTTWHAAWAAPQPAAFDLAIDGNQVATGLSPAHRVTHDDEATILHLGFEATAGEPVVVRVSAATAAMSGSRTLKSRASSR